MNVGPHECDLHRIFRAKFSEGCMAFSSLLVGRKCRVSVSVRRLANSVLLS
jgi:hypothetical protein